MTEEDMNRLNSYPDRMEYGSYGKNSYDVSGTPTQPSKKNPVSLKQSPEVVLAHIAPY